MTSPWQRSGLGAVCTWLAIAWSAGCGSVGLEPCDIRDKACQVDVYYALQRLRGDGWDAFGSMPPVDVITAADYRRQLEAAQPPPTDPDAQPNPWDVARQLLGVITRETSAGAASIDDRVRNTGAFYSSRNRAVTVIDHGGSSSTDEGKLRGDTALLAHEIVHALQDRELAFGRFQGDADGWFSWRAAVEGEATLYQHLVGLEMLGQSIHDDDYETWLPNWLRRGQHSVVESSSPFYAVGWLVYPLATRKFMSGIPPLDCQVRVPDAYARVGDDRMGAAHVFALQVADVRGEEGEAERQPAWETALRWVDDRIWVFKHGERGVATEWRIRFRSAADARAAAARFADRSLRSVEVVDGDLRLRGAEDEALLDTWEGARCGAP
jgi:hypothetical protein